MGWVLVSRESRQQAKASRNQAKADAAAAKAARKATRPVYRKKRYWGLSVIALIVIIVVASSSNKANTIVGNHSGAPTSAWIHRVAASVPSDGEI
jgi:hypothetical protein